jgi:hypothetical protein
MLRGEMNNDSGHFMILVMKRNEASTQCQCILNPCTYTGWTKCMNCSNCFHINFYHVKLMCSLNFELPCMIADFDSTRLPITYCYLFYYFKLYPGLTNSAHFAEIRRIRSSPNSKIAELLFINSKKFKK